MGQKLWAPMWAMSLMGFVAGIIAAVIRSGSISSGSAETTVLAQSHLVSGLMFVGFAAVFAAISFAIARILGTFRSGGGKVQETLGVPVQTLKMPATGRIFIVGMMMAMMTLVVAVIIHFVAASSTASGALSVADSEGLSVTLEAVRRLAVAVYLVAIAFGLATITKVLRFQAIRLKELPELIKKA